jgi:uncharacterized protein (DUF362 family)
MAWPERISRRAFLAAMPAAVAVASACRRRPYRLADFVVPERSTVGLYPAASYSEDFGDVIYRGLVDLDVAPRIPGRRVFLKPNMVEYEADTAINTQAAVVVGAAAAFMKAGAREVVVGEGPGHRRDIEYLLTSTGLYDQLRELRVRFVDLNHDDVQVVKLRSNFTRLDEIALPISLLQSDFVVSMPKLKTHHWAGITASMKNFFGVVPGAVYGWPKNILHVRGIDGSILDLNATIRPQFSIVDAVTAMEGDGPIMGKPRQMQMIAMGSDLAAVDAACARLIGVAPDDIPYLAGAGVYLGNIAASRIDFRGERPQRFQTIFDRVKRPQPARA